MPRAAFCGLPHSESEVYYGKPNAIGRSLIQDAVTHTADSNPRNLGAPKSHLLKRLWNPLFVAPQTDSAELGYLLQSQTGQTSTRANHCFH